MKFNAFFQPKYRLYRRGLFVVLGVLLLILVGLVLYFGTQVPSMESLENPETDLSTQVISADGQVLGNYYQEEHRVNVRYEQIPPFIIDALIATEDIRFRKHPGIDLRGILATVKDLVLYGDRRGASTVTMQLARNLYNKQVGRDRSLKRKVREMVAAGFLERRYTKEEILTFYFNTVPFGGTNYGLQTAARIYFNKDAQALNPQESATLVGMLKANTRYNPLRNPEASRQRRNVVFSQMEKYGFLSPAERDSLSQLPLVTQQGHANTHDRGLAPYFREHLRHWLHNWSQRNGYDLYTSGLRVYTTINSRLQQHAERAVWRHMSDLQVKFEQQIRRRKPWKREPDILTDAMRRSTRYNTGLSEGLPHDSIVAGFHVEQPMKVFVWDTAANQPSYVDTTMTPWDSLRYYARFLETGLVTIEPGTGHVLAWVGGTDYRFFKYDHVQKSKRQVGSTFKPFVYAAAINNGMSPCDIEQNVRPRIMLETGDVWEPKNADGEYTGPMTLKRAMGNSVNAVTARLMDKIKPRVVTEIAYAMGIETELEEVYSLALGTTDLSVYELTSAYATFANMGVWNKPIYVTRIEDRFGNVLYEQKPETRQALNPQTAYQMIDLLRYVVNSGTAAGLRWYTGLPHDIDVGGKTGTTQNHSDGWFMGFTPDYATGVWVGASDRRVRFPTLVYGQGARMAMPIWGYYMKAVYEDEQLDIPRTRFKAPEGFQVELNCPDVGVRDKAEREKRMREALEQRSPSRLEW